MSVVTGAVLITSVSDELSAREIRQWLRGQDRGDFRPVEDYFGGPKHPQMIVLGIGLNYFSDIEKEFIEFVLSRPWQYPEDVVLILSPEQRVTQIYRPEIGGKNDRNISTLYKSILS